MSNKSCNFIDSARCTDCRINAAATSKHCRVSEEEKIHLNLINRSLHRNNKKRKVWNCKNLPSINIIEIFNLAFYILVRNWHCVTCFNTIIQHRMAILVCSPWNFSFKKLGKVFRKLIMINIEHEFLQLDFNPMTCLQILKKVIEFAESIKICQA